MLGTTWYGIECVDGASATLYLPAHLRGDQLDMLNAAFASLPATVRTVRVQIGGLRTALAPVAPVAPPRATRPQPRPATSYSSEVAHLCSTGDASRTAAFL